MSATQFPPAASPQSTSLPPVAQTPSLGVVSADGVAARATGYRITTRDGYRLAVTASRITPEVLLVVAQPDGTNVPVWVDLATAEQLADALAWECQDARLAGAL